MKPDTFFRSVFGRSLALPAVIAVLSAAAPSSGMAQTAQATVVSPQLVALTNDLVLQIKEIERNQAEIEERLAKVEESVRQARIFAARAGRKGGGK